MDEIEEQAQALIEADRQIQNGINVYRAAGWSAAEIEARLSELLEDEQ